MAPLPNALFSHCGADDFAADDGGSGPLDLGRFITAMIVVTGFSLPLVLAHSEIIKPGASFMSIIGGGYVQEDKLRGAVLTASRLPQAGIRDYSGLHCCVQRRLRI